MLKYFFFLNSDAASQSLYHTGSSLSPSSAFAPASVAAAAATATGSALSSSGAASEQTTQPIAAVAPPVQSTPPIPKKPNAHTQALVAQLVRKEFEKSLGQLEFPNGGEQDVYFIPNANQAADFLMCLGLEEVVRCVQEHINNKSQKAQEKEKEKDKQANATSNEQGK